MNEQVAATDTNQDHTDWLRRRAQGRYTATPALARFVLDLLEPASDKSMLVLNALTSGMGDALVARSVLWGMPQPTVMVDPDPDVRSSYEEWPKARAGAAAMAPEEYAANRPDGLFDLVFCNACQTERPAEQNAYWAEMAHQAAPSLVGYGIVWKQLLDCVTSASCLKQGGKAAVLVPVSCLGGEAPARARGLLVNAGLIERVILLGSGVLEGRTSLVPQTALVVMSCNNESVAIHDVRNFDIAQVKADAVIDDRVGTLKILSNNNVIDSNNGMALLDGSLFDQDAGDRRYGGEPIENYGIRVLLGSKIDVEKSAKAGDCREVRILRQADVSAGLALSEPVFLSGKDIDRAVILQDGDIVLPRVSPAPVPVLVENLRSVESDLPVVVLRSHIVVRCPRSFELPLIAYVAAALSARGALDSVLLGDRTKHVGTKELRRLRLLIPANDQVREACAELYLKRAHELQQAQSKLNTARSAFADFCDAFDHMTF